MNVKTRNITCKNQYYKSISEKILLNIEMTGTLIMDKFCLILTSSNYKFQAVSSFSLKVPE